jgi:predicted ester cyclase
MWEWQHEINDLIAEGDKVVVHAVVEKHPNHE